jgi:hypothetical protein
VILDQFEERWQNLTITDWYGLRVRKMSRTNKTRIIFGDVLINAPFGDNVDIETWVYKKNGEKIKIFKFVQVI